ncbi:hypothetical protein ACFOWZ_21375 [Lentzea rhizosphaerae]|uniref:Uncharacterized protein n=1 Tax=Lentzea rhizosphaerae TaxID=2041025 RepID=A0ABV8BVR1_9PSEU
MSSSRRDLMTAASAPPLSVRGLVKRFSGVMALQGADFGDPAGLSTMGFARRAEAGRRQVGNGRTGSHLSWADPRRGWDFVSTGLGNGSVRRCTTRCSARTAERPAGAG